MASPLYRDAAWQHIRHIVKPSNKLLSKTTTKVFTDHQGTHQYKKKIELHVNKFSHAYLLLYYVQTLIKTNGLKIIICMLVQLINIADTSNIGKIFASAKTQKLKTSMQTETWKT